MTAALTLLVGALAAGWLVPGLLHRTDLRRHDPVLLVVVWLLSMIGVLVSAAVGVVFLLLPSHGPGTAVLTAVHECWAAIQHGTPPETEKLAGLLGLALLIAFVVRLAVVFVRGLRRRARAVKHTCRSFVWLHARTRTHRTRCGSPTTDHSRSAWRGVPALSSPPKDLFAIWTRKLWKLSSRTNVPTSRAVTTC